MKYVSGLLFIVLVAVALMKLGSQNNEVQPSISEQSEASAPTPAVEPSQLSDFEAVADVNLQQPQSKSKEADTQELLYERELGDLFATIPKLKKEDLEEDFDGFTPLELKEAKALAEIQNLIAQNQKYPKVTQRLYSNCMNDRELATTVRALCYFHALELSVELNNSNDIAQADIPLEVKQLALKIKN